MTRIKVFSGASDTGLEDKVNEWIRKSQAKVKDIQLSSTDTAYDILVVYEV